MLRSPQLWCRYSRTVHFGTQLAPSLAPNGRRLMTLAIETSCDDSSVAILSHHDALSNQDPLDPSSPAATLHFHEKFTADNSEHRGIHPLLALRSHRENLAPLITRALHALPLAPSASTTDPATTIPIRTSDGTWVVKRKPDFISVTRGPGMRGSLSTGIDTAKGLSLAWQVPLLGVHHMHAHALTPRLVSALETRAESRAGPKPEFPFLSLLVSGGNTLLVHSKALTEHTVLVERCDVSIGDAIDKMARNICAESLQQLPPEIMYGHLLESFAFPNGVADHKYTAPATRGEQIGRRTTRWGWSLPVPFGQTRAGEKSRVMQFTFAGLGTAVEKICTGPKEMSREERVELAREGMRIAFEHLASRVEWALDSLREQGEQISTLVVSGGVASNKYLKTILQSHLSTTLAHVHTTLTFPPPALCTDNAAMIAWTGLEMYEAGWRSEGPCMPLRKWPLDAVVDGNEGGWVREEDSSSG